MALKMRVESAPELVSLCHMIVLPRDDVNEAVRKCTPYSEYL